MHWEGSIVVLTPGILLAFLGGGEEVDGGVSIGLIIGIVGGGVVLIVCVCCLVIYCKSKESKLFYLLNHPLGHRSFYHYRYNIFEIKWLLGDWKTYEKCWDNSLQVEIRFSIKTKYLGKYNLLCF